MRYGLLNVMHHDDKQTPRPMVSFYAALAAAPARDVAATSALPRPALSMSGDELAGVTDTLGLRRDVPLVAFAPGAEFGSAKRWPAAHFAELARMVVHAYPDAQVVLLGSGKDKDVCAEIVALAPFVRSLAGVTSLAQAIGVIAASDAVVSNDSGLLHIASALNRPVIAIYGPTDPDHAPPFSDVAKSLSLRLDCSPCRQRECPLQHHRCMRNISADMVWEPLRRMVGTR